MMLMMSRVLLWHLLSPLFALIAWVMILQSCMFLPCQAAPWRSLVNCSTLFSSPAANGNELPWSVVDESAKTVTLLSCGSATDGGTDILVQDSSCSDTTHRNFTLLIRNATLDQCNATLQGTVFTHVLLLNSTVRNSTLTLMLHPIGPGHVHLGHVDSLLHLEESVIEDSVITLVDTAVTVNSDAFALISTSATVFKSGSSLRTSSTFSLVASWEYNETISDRSLSLLNTSNTTFIDTELHLSGGGLITTSAAFEGEIHVSLFAIGPSVDFRRSSVVISGFSIDRTASAQGSHRFVVVDAPEGASFTASHIEIADTTIIEHGSLTDAFVVWIGGPRKTGFAPTSITIKNCYISFSTPLAQGRGVGVLLLMETEVGGTAQFVGNTLVRLDNTTVSLQTNASGGAAVMNASGFAGRLTVEFSDTKAICRGPSVALARLARADAAIVSLSRTQVTLTSTGCRAGGVEWQDVEKLTLVITNSSRLVTTTDGGTFNAVGCGNGTRRHTCALCAVNIARLGSFSIAGESALRAEVLSAPHGSACGIWLHNVTGVDGQGLLSIGGSSSVEAIASGESPEARATTLLVEGYGQVGFGEILVDSGALLNASASYPATHANSIVLTDASLHTLAVQGPSTRITAQLHFNASMDVHLSSAVATVTNIIMRSTPARVSIEDAHLHARALITSGNSGDDAVRAFPAIQVYNWLIVGGVGMDSSCTRSRLLAAITGVGGTGAAAVRNVETRNVLPLQHHLPRLGGSKLESFIDVFRVQAPSVVCFLIADSTILHHFSLQDADRWDNLLNATLRVSRHPLTEFGGVAFRRYDVPKLALSGLEHVVSPLVVSNTTLDGHFEVFYPRFVARSIGPQAVLTTAFFLVHSTLSGVELAAPDISVLASVTPGSLSRADVSAVGMLALSCRFASAQRGIYIANEDRDDEVAFSVTIAVEGDDSEPRRHFMAAGILTMNCSVATPEITMIRTWLLPLVVHVREVDGEHRSLLQSQFSAWAAGIAVVGFGGEMHPSLHVDVVGGSFNISAAPTKDGCVDCNASAVHCGPALNSSAELSDDGPLCRATVVNAVVAVAASHHAAALRQQVATSLWAMPRPLRVRVHIEGCTMRLVGAKTLASVINIPSLTADADDDGHTGFDSEMSLSVSRCNITSVHCRNFTALSVDPAAVTKRSPAVQGRLKVSVERCIVDGIATPHLIAVSAPASGGYEFSVSDCTWMVNTTSNGNGDAGEVGAAPWVSAVLQLQFHNAGGPLLLGNSSFSEGIIMLKRNHFENFTHVLLPLPALHSSGLSLDSNLVPLLKLQCNFIGPLRRVDPVMFTGYPQDRAIFWPLSYLVQQQVCPAFVRSRTKSATVSPSLSRPSATPSLSLPASRSRTPATTSLTASFSHTPSASPSHPTRTRTKNPTVTISLPALLRTPSPSASERTLTSANSASPTRSRAISGTLSRTWQTSSPSISITGAPTRSHSLDLSRGATTAARHSVPQSETVPHGTATWPVPVSTTRSPPPLSGTASGSKSGSSGTSSSSFSHRTRTSTPSVPRAIPQCPSSSIIGVGVRLTNDSATENATTSLDPDLHIAVFEDTGPVLLSAEAAFGGSLLLLFSLQADSRDNNVEAMNPQWSTRAGEGANSATVSIRCSSPGEGDGAGGACKDLLAHATSPPNGFSITRVNTTMLAMRLGRVEGVRLVADQSLVITFTEGAFACANMPIAARRRRFVIPGTPTLAMQAVRSASTVASASAALAAASASGAALDAQALAVFDLISCRGETRELSASAMLTLAPLQVGPGAAGRLYGNVILIGSLLAFQLLAFLAKCLAVRKMGIGASSAMAEGATVARLPAWTLLLLELLHQGTSLLAIRELASGRVSVIAVLGAVHSIVFPAGCLYFIRRVTRPQLLPSDDDLLFFRYEPGTIEKLFWRSWCRFAGGCAGALLLPTGRWGPEMARTRYCSIFSHCIPLWSGFGALPAAIATMNSLVAASSARSPVGCALRYSLLILMYVVLGGVTTVAQPFRTRFFCLTQVASYLVLAGVLCAALMASRNPLNDSAQFAVAAVLAMQTALTVLRAGYGVWLRWHEVLNWRPFCESTVWNVMRDDGRGSASREQLAVVFGQTVGPSRTLEAPLIELMDTRPAHERINGSSSSNNNNNNNSSNTETAKNAALVAADSPPPHTTGQEGSGSPVRLPRRSACRGASRRGTHSEAVAAPIFAAEELRVLLGSSGSGNVV